MLTTLLTQLQVYLEMFRYSVMMSFMSIITMNLMLQLQVDFTLVLVLLQKNLLKLMMVVFLDIVLPIFPYKQETWIISQVLNGCWTQEMDTQK